MHLTEILALSERYLLQNYGRRLDLAFVRGDGCYVWDSEGRRYLDFLAGIAVNTLGHGHPALVKAISEQAATLLHSCNYFHSEPLVLAAQSLVERSGLDRVFFSNSGAEANEALLKAARRWAAARWGEAVRPNMITFGGSFHGRTLATLSATGNAKVQAGFAPLMPGFIQARYNDLDDVRAKLGDTVCAVLLEPIQGEGGVIPATDEFLRGLRGLCDERGVLLLLDEIQTGVGRTGSFFAYQQVGITPDGVSLAKGLAGGVPIGATLFSEELAEALPAGSHGTTFGGNPLATAAALATLRTIDSEGLVEHAARVGGYLRQRLQELVDRDQRLTEVRGKGLMLAVGLRDDCANELRDACADYGLIVNAVRPNAIRLLPALILTEAQVDEGLAIISSALATLAA